MAESKVISVRIHQRLLEAIDRLAVDRHPPRRPDSEPNRSQLILDALESYIYDVNNVSKDDERIAAFVDAVNKRITESLALIGRNKEPDMEAIRDRILASNKSALDRRRLRWYLDQFIEELQAHEQQVN